MLNTARAARPKTFPRWSQADTVGIVLPTFDSQGHFSSCSGTSQGSTGVKNGGMLSEKTRTEQGRRIGWECDTNTWYVCMALFACPYIQRKADGNRHHGSRPCDLHCPYYAQRYFLPVTVLPALFASIDTVRVKCIYIDRLDNDPAGRSHRIAAKWASHTLPERLYIT